MRVFVFGSGEAGGHVLRQLAAKGHEAVAVAENENRAEELKMLGAAEVMVSKDGSFIKAIAGCEAMIYIAGSSPASGEDQDILVDHGTVLDSIKGAQQQGVERIVYLSPVRVGESEESEKTGAKDKPEEWIKEGGLAYTIIRPAKMVSKPGKGMIKAAKTFAASTGEIPYEDVAAILVEALGNRAAFNKAFEITAGDTSIKEALQSL
jgi:uncharacterized protein YbjT (DUF2867 family)